MLLAVALLSAFALPSCLGCLAPSLVAHLMFLEDDTSADGNLHLSEMIDTFHIYDANKDGRVSRHEYTEHEIALDASFADIAHALYDVWDFNNDHHLEMDDYVTFYRSIDIDGDDNVHEAEFVHFWTQLICRIGHHHDSFCLDQCH